MRGLYNYATSELITKYVDVMPEKTAVKVINKLLDGSDHVQIIGDPNTILNIGILTTKTGKETIESLDAEGALFMVEDGFADVYYGRILSRDNWEKTGVDLFRTTLVLSTEAVV